MFAGSKRKGGFLQIMTVHTLGGFWISNEANQRICLDKAKSKKARSLLRFFVANHGRWISTSSLCELYWPGMDEEYAKMNLQCTIHMIRKLIGTELVFYRDGGYIFDPNGQVTIDVEIFIKLIKQAEKTVEISLKKQLLSKAVEMYSGDYMQEDLYEDWVLRLREYYREIFVKALTELARIEFEEQNYERALDLSKRAMVEDMFNEQACLLAMKAHLKNGNCAEGVKLFRSFSERLKRELQVEPSGELLSVYQSLSSSPGEKKVIVVEGPACLTDSENIISQLKTVLRSSDKVEKLSASKVAVWLDGMNEEDANKLVQRIQRSLANLSGQLNIYMRKAR